MTAIAIPANTSHPHRDRDGAGVGGGGNGCSGRSGSLGGLGRIEVARCHALKNEIRLMVFLGLVSPAKPRFAHPRVNGAWAASERADPG
jgi:hypothetical protein